MLLVNIKNKVNSIIKMPVMRKGLNYVCCMTLGIFGIHRIIKKKYFSGILMFVLAMFCVFPEYTNTYWSLLALNILLIPLYIDYNNYRLTYCYHMMDEEYEIISKKELNKETVLIMLYEVIALISYIVIIILTRRIIFVITIYSSLTALKYSFILRSELVERMNQ